MSYYEYNGCVYVVSCSKDGKLCLWEQKNGSHYEALLMTKLFKNLKCGDYYTSLFSCVNCDESKQYDTYSDTAVKNIICATENNSIIMYSIDIKKDNKGKNVMRFIKEKVFKTSHKENIKYIDIHNTLEFIACSTVGKSTDIYVYDRKGKEKKIQINQMKNYQLNVSRNGQYLAVGTAMRYINILKTHFVYYRIY